MEHWPAPKGDAKHAREGVRVQNRMTFSRCSMRRARQSDHRTSAMEPNDGARYVRVESVPKAAINGPIGHRVEKAKGTTHSNRCRTCLRHYGRSFEWRSCIRDSERCSEEGPVCCRTDNDGDQLICANLILFVY